MNRSLRNLASVFVLALATTACSNGKITLSEREDFNDWWNKVSRDTVIMTATPASTTAGPRM